MDIIRKLSKYLKEGDKCNQIDERSLFDLAKQYKKSVTELQKGVDSLARALKENPSKSLSYISKMRDELMDLERSLRALYGR